MISRENYSMLYEEVINNKELTTKQLNNCGFNSKEINNLIEKGIVERIKRGQYLFKDVDNLYLYGKYLISKKKHDKASLCFERCYEINPNHLSTCFQLFIRSIHNRDFDNIYIYFDKLLSTDNVFYSIDNNYYLYLLSFITELPEDLNKHARLIQYENIEVLDTDSRYQDVKMENLIRNAVFQRKFTYAINKHNDFINKKDHLSVQDIVNRELIYLASWCETMNRKTIISYAIEKRNQEIISFYKSIQKRRELSIIEKSSLKLAEQFIKIEETLEVPKVIETNTTNFFKLIEYCDYKKALDLCNNFNNKSGIKKEESSLNILLSNICELIDNINSKKDDIKEDNNQLDVDDLSSYLFSKIVYSLMNNQLEEAYDLINQYMSCINKLDYEFLINDLIKISLLENDKAFTKPLTVLTLIDNNIFDVNINNYIKDFYSNLSQNKYEEAKIYLDIISNISKISNKEINIIGLCKALELLESKTKTNANVVSEKIDNDVKNKEPVRKNKKILTNDDQEVIKEKEFVKKKHEELVENKGIILLRPMNDVRINLILDIAKEYDDMVTSVIGDGKNKQVLFKYKLITHDKIDYSELMKDGNMAYNEQRYEDCINNYLIVLHKSDKPGFFVYSKIGLSYMRLGKKSLAIDYLTVANFYARDEKTNIEFDQLLLKLTGNLNYSNIKPRFNMNQSDFDYNNDYYCIDNFEEINNYILESGLDVESACREYNLSQEEIALVKLIYAREFYSQGNITRGDIFLKSVERSKDKTKFVIEKYEEVRKNKKYYQNRQNDAPIQLSLKMVPNK